MRKKHLLEIDGYNSDLEVWGWEDNDVQLRLKRVLSLRHVETGRALHLSHGDDKRSLKGMGRSESHVLNLGILCGRYSAGNFRGTYKRDLQVWGDKSSEANSCGS